MGIGARNGSKRVLPTVAGVAVGIIVVAGVGLWIGRSLPTDTATPQVLHGTVSIVGGDGSEFGVALDGSQAGTSFALGPVPWKDSRDSWHNGGPIDCLKPSTSGQRIRFGVIHVTGTENDSDLVAWVDCS